MPDLYREPVDQSAEKPSAPAPLSSAEMEIMELEKQIAQKRALLGKEKDASAEALAKAERPLEQVIGAEKPAPASPVAAAAPAAAPVIPAIEIKPEVKQFKRLEKNQQLKNLVDLAFQKGVVYAADVARDLESPYLMDEFHDALVGELHKELVEKGKLEEI